jgi:hypothetical protein
MFRKLFGKKGAAPAASNGINILAKETLAAAQVSILSKEQLLDMDFSLLVDYSGSIGGSFSRIRGSLMDEPSRSQRSHRTTTLMASRWSPSAAKLLFMMASPLPK